MPRKIFTPDDGLGEFDYDNIDQDALLRMGDEGFAAVYPPQGADELFDDQFTRRAREITRQPNDIHPSYQVPQRRGMWSGNNSLGNEVAFAPNANNQQTILKLDELDFPGVWSVMLGISYSDNAWPAGFTGFACTALVNAGVGGVTQEIEVDWAQGTVFSLPMNAVNIIAKYQQSNNIPTDLRLSVSLCKGKVAGRPPTRTIEIPGLPSGGGVALSDTFRIPSFARSVIIQDRTFNVAASSFYNTTSSLLLVRNINVGSFAVATVTGNVMLNFASNGYQIPDGARYFALQVSNPQVRVDANAIFSLSL